MTLAKSVLLKKNINIRLGIDARGPSPATRERESEGRGGAEIQYWENPDEPFLAAALGPLAFTYFLQQSLP